MNKPHDTILHIYRSKIISRHFNDVFMTFREIAVHISHWVRNIIRSIFVSRLNLLWQFVIRKHILEPYTYIVNIRACQWNVLIRFRRYISFARRSESPRPPRNGIVNPLQTRGASPNSSDARPCQWSFKYPAWTRWVNHEVGRHE